MGIRDQKWADDVFCGFELGYHREVVEALLYQPDEYKRQRILIDWRRNERLPEVGYAKDTFVRLPRRRHTEDAQWLYPERGSWER